MFYIVLLKYKYLLFLIWEVEVLEIEIKIIKKEIVIVIKSKINLSFIMVDKVLI